MVLAIKFYDDTYYDNEFYSKIGGIRCRELNRLEAEFLVRVDYDLHILPETFEQYSADLSAKVKEPEPMVEEKPVNEKLAAPFPQSWSQSSLKTVPSSNDICQEATQ